MTAVTAFLILLACAIRWIPHLLTTGLGVDHWFWKLYVRVSREQRTFPPRLRQYVLDDEQWYPPLFPLALVMFPWALSERASRVIPVAIDALRLALAVAVVHRLTGDAIATLTAGVVYATTPILTSYNTQLNPRGLGALFLDALIVLALWSRFHPDRIVSISAAVVVLASVVLLTHKMTTQLLWFLSAGGAIVTGRWIVAAVIPASMAAALILSGGFYRRVWSAHRDIVAFWHRNWRWLQADPIRESPLYGTASFRTPTRFYQPGIRGFLRHCRYMFGFDPWAWLLPIAVLTAARPLPQIATTALTWSALVVVFAVATLAVPGLRSLGSGYFYLYNAAFPVAVAWGCLGIRTGPALLVFGVALTASVSSLVLFFVTLTRSRRRVDQGPLASAIDFLRGAPPGTVWCLPLNPSDLVAYHTGQRVLYGGHGYGFRRLEPIFPRLLESAAAICRRYGVRYVLTADGFLPDSLRSELAVDDMVAFGSYRVLTLSPSVTAETADA